MRLFTLGLCAATIFLGSCSSIARGVTEAIIEEQKNAEDARECEISGRGFDGILQSLETQAPSTPKITKVLMVHGISSHKPGYSNRLQKKLYAHLGLSTTDPVVKTIDLDSDTVKWGKDEPHTLGQLRITRHADPAGQRQLLFYELTWSPITDPQKQALEGDSANNDGLKRASLNGSLKSFMNTTVPDLLIYNGNGYDKITASVRQSVCWMMGDSWEGLPESGTHECRGWDGSTFSTIASDDHFFITHSLGSRITIDTIQNFSGSDSAQPLQGPDSAIRRAIHGKEFTVFMMANQLPLLQMGRDAPANSGMADDYCLSGSPKADQRVMKRMNIVAFSDPNDILSYPVPPDFAERNIDSRICPDVRNVSLHITTEKNLFDTLSFANPLDAHNGYMEDDRVIEMIARGIRRNNVPPLTGQRCRWIEIKEIVSKNDVREKS